jgi:HAD superfamily hydrolase (TIGR01509 family)
MSPPPPLRAVIFDFDGVLADTEELHYAAFQSVAAGAGLTLTHADYFEQFLGLPDRDCLAALYARAARPVTDAELDRLVGDKRAAFAQRSRRARLYPGVADTLRRLHARLALAIASGAFRDEIEPILEREGVRSLFAAVVGAGDVRAGKPAPDPFLEALRQLRQRAAPGLAAAECVVVEDSPRGLAAARAAGMRCVAVTTYHERAALAGAEAFIEHVCNLHMEDLT